jgi:hypothetical protein
VFETVQSIDGNLSSIDQNLSSIDENLGPIEATVPSLNANLRSLSKRCGRLCAVDRTFLQCRRRFHVIPYLSNRKSGSLRKSQNS